MFEVKVVRDDIVHQVTPLFELEETQARALIIKAIECLKALSASQGGLGKGVGVEEAKAHISADFIAMDERVFLGYYGVISPVQV